MMKIADLFRVQKDSSTYNESGSHRTVFYAESGMLVHYLYDNDMVIRLSNYFGLKIDRNLPVDELLSKPSASALISLIRCCAIM